MKVFATFICKDGFSRREQLDKLYPTYRLASPASTRLWMAKPTNAACLPRESREFYLESKKVIKNQYGTTIQAIYRENA